MNSFYNNNVSKDNIDTGMLYKYITDGKLSAAFSLASQFEKSTKTDVLFNIALVHHLVGNNQKAIEFIDSALTALRQQAPVMKTAPVSQAMQTARILDITNKSYLRPVTNDYVNGFPELMMGDILMAGTVFANLANLPAKKSNYIVSLIGSEFENFKKEF